MMLPSTKREARLIGKRSARLVEGARRAGSELLEQSRDLAEETVESVHRGQRRAAARSKGRRRASTSR
jgi:F0F1-type ATP synthase membrane subunit b/b'